MAAPRRHGHKHWPDAPTPLSQGGDAAAVRGKPLQRADVEEPKGYGVIPTKEMEKWLRTLPPQKITHLVLSSERVWQPSRPVGFKFTLFSYDKIPDSYVWVITDVDYYATFTPNDGLVSIPQNVPREALVGILKWELLFGGVAPLQTVARRMSPYNVAPGAVQSTSGWPWMETPFGVRRMPSFALFATGNEEITVEVTIEDLPRFPITRLGVNLHGFTVATAHLPSAWR
jgi:hypothetical protein